MSAPGATTNTDSQDAEFSEPAESAESNRPSASPGLAESVGTDEPRPSVPSLEKVCLATLTILAIFYTLYFARALLLPATLAVLLNLVFKPVTKRLSRLGIPTAATTVLIFILMLTVAALGARVLWEPAKQWIAEAPRSLQEVKRQLSSYTSPFEQLDDAKKEVEEMTMPGEADAVTVQIKQPSLSVQMANTTGTLLPGILISSVLLFFLLASGDRFLEKTVEMVPTWRGKRDTVALFREIQQKISAYLGTITLINIGLGAVIGLGLWLIDMPNPVLWGVLAALLNYIPFAGFVAGMAIVFLVAVGEFNNLGQALLAPLIYGVANGVEAYFVTPAMLGKTVSLDPVVILLAIFLGGWVWGIGGIFLAIPMLLVVKIACDNYQTLKPIGVFLGS